MTPLLALSTLLATQLLPTQPTCLPAFGAAEIRTGLEAIAEQDPAAAGALRAAVRSLEEPRDRLRFVAARDEIERARLQGGATPVLDYALGLLYARGPDIVIGTDSGLVHRRTRNQTNAEIHARRHLLAAARSRSSVADEAAVELARLALATRTRASLDAAAEALDSVGPVTAGIDLLRAYVLEAKGEAEAAEAAARRALAAAGTRCTAAWHALALARSALGEADSAGALYLHGLALARDAADDVVALFFEDLRPLLSAEEIEAYAALEPAERVRWMRRYWELSAARWGRTPEARVGEHLRRLRVAHARFRRQANEGARPSPEVALWVDPGKAAFPWDDRGLVYIRHGEPDDHVAGGFDLDQALPTTWVYGRGGEVWTISFKQLGGRNLYPDWVAVPIPVCVEGDRSLDHVVALGRYDPRYRVPTLDCEDPSRSPRNSFQAHLAQRALDAALASESAPRSFEHVLEVFANAYAFRDASGPVVQVVVWLPSQSESNDRPERVELLMALAGSTDVSRLDTIVALPPAPAGEAWRFVASLTAPDSSPSWLTIAIADAADAARGGTIALGHAVPDLSGGRPALSDIVVAFVQDGGALRRGETTLDPVPAHAVEANERFRLYYELYGAPPDASYRTTIRIDPVGEPGVLPALARLFRRKRAFELRFDDVAPGGVVRQDRTVETDLAPGPYRLRIRVDLPDGVRLERETVFAVRDAPRSGATRRSLDPPAPGPLAPPGRPPAPAPRRR